MAGCFWEPAGNWAHEGAGTRGGGSVLLELSTAGANRQNPTGLLEMGKGGLRDCLMWASPALVAGEEPWWP